MVSQLVTASCYPFLCFYLAITLDMRLQGIALCSITLNALTLLLMLILTWMDSETYETCFWPDSSSFSDFHSYMSVGGPNILQQMLDMLSYEILTLTAGLIGVTEQAAQVMMSMMSEISFTTGLGVSSALCTIMGQQIGRGNLETVNAYFFFIIKISLALFVIQFIILCQFSRDYFFPLMTDQLHVLQLISALNLFFCVNAFSELVRMGLLRGFAKAFRLNVQFVKWALFS